MVTVEKKFFQKIVNILKTNTFPLYRNEQKTIYSYIIIIVKVIQNLIFQKLLRLFNSFYCLGDYMFAYPFHNILDVLNLEGMTRDIFPSERDEDDKIVVNVPTQCSLEKNVIQVYLTMSLIGSRDNNLGRKMT